MNALEQAIQACNESELAFCKFISANDVGGTGSHQSGFYIAKDAWSLLFDRPGAKGENMDRFVSICWHDYGETDSRFIWYGQGTRSEYRITRFGKGFPFLADQYIGSLLVLARVTADYYRAFVLDADADTDTFLGAFGLSPTDTNSIIKRIDPESRVRELIEAYTVEPNSGFPTSDDLSVQARTIWRAVYPSDRAKQDPDRTLLEWVDAEYALFRRIESACYDERLRTPFADIQELIDVANTLLNRRKSRAGKALEHHLAALFAENDLQFEQQVITEHNKRPDFIFPCGEAYHRKDWADEKLVFLGAKTTCKDRWRQILNEADRIPTKHLFTLQQGISSQQLREMQAEHVVLVVPQEYVSSFPKQYRDSILTLDAFIRRTRSATKQ